MSKEDAIGRYLKKLPDVQRQAVARVLATTRPVKPVPSVLRQWLIWLALSIVAGGIVLAGLGPQSGLLERMSHVSSAGFMVLVLFGSAVTAWNGIASSMPGDEPRLVQKTLGATILFLVLAVPFLFFAGDSWHAVWAHGMESGWACSRTVLIISVPAWCFLGWMVSRNASFQPAWTAAWLSMSASLLGTGITQAHCAHWEVCHVLVMHVLPMGVAIFVPVYAGSFWFSRWRR